MPDLNAHLAQVVQALAAGRLTVFLGAGANLADRPEGVSWRPGQTDQLPHGGELSAHLAQAFGVETSWDLARVSQNVALLSGTGPLYDELHSLFDADYALPSLHRLLADLPSLLRERGFPKTDDPLRRRLLLVSTNYDDLLERAFTAVNEPFHLVAYEADGEHRGQFFHRDPAGGLEWIERPNEYRGLLGDEHSVILKIHGTVDRPGGELDSYVITEDHYIEYLTRTDATALIPVPLPALLKNRHVLFLGYGLRDWNLRVILHRLWGDRKLSWKSWAIQRAPAALDCELWEQRDVQILDLALGEYVPRLRERVGAL